MLKTLSVVSLNLLVLDIIIKKQTKNVNDIIYGCVL